MITYWHSIYGANKLGHLTLNSTIVKKKKKIRILKAENDGIGKKHAWFITDKILRVVLKVKSRQHGEC